MGDGEIPAAADGESSKDSGTFVINFRPSSHLFIIITALISVRHKEERAKKIHGEYYRASL